MAASTGLANQATTPRPDDTKSPLPQAPQTFDKIPDADSNTGLQESGPSIQRDAPASYNNNNISVSHGLLRRYPAPGEKGSQKSRLPPEKVFSIQLGSEVFRLSGASIASDERHLIFPIFSRNSSSITRAVEP